MEQLSLYRCLGVEPPAVVSFYGAGGKTTLIKKLALEAEKTGKKVLLTTTTRVYPPEDIPIFLNRDLKAALQELKNFFQKGNTAVLGKSILEDGKVEGPAPGDIELIVREIPAIILVEADGSKGFPIKGYANHEPAVPARSDIIVPIIGADALGLPLNETSVHRPGHLAKTLDVEKNAIIDFKLIGITFQHMFALGLELAPRSQLKAIFNKADLLENPGTSVLEIAGFLRSSDCNKRFLVTSGREQHPVKLNLSLRSGESPVKVSCVLLAAGSSSRMGRDKLSLPVKGKRMLEQTVEQVIKAGIEEIIVVTRPQSGWPEIIGTKKCRIIVNPDHESGMAGSLKLGLSAVSSDVQGVIFALGDQPHVPAEVYRSLISSYRKNLKIATCPVYMGKRGNPTLIDRQAWPELMKITGDRGGRNIISRLERNQLDLVETKTSSVITDIDTPEDYLSLPHFFG